MNSCVLHVPRHAKVRSKEPLLGLFPHGGSTIHQDASIDAQYIADAERLGVLAIHRPSLELLLGRSGVAAMHSVTRDVDQTVARLNGVEKIALISRSVGATAALQFAVAQMRKRDTLPITHIAGVEPAGSQEHNVSDGWKYYFRYMKAEGPYLQSHPDPEQAINSHRSLSQMAQNLRLLSIGINLPKDILCNQRQWCRPIVAEMAGQLIVGSETNVSLFYGDHSFVAASDTPNINELTPENFASFDFESSMQGNLAELRRLAEAHPDSLAITVNADTSHSMYDRRTYFTDTVHPTIEAALAA